MFTVIRSSAGESKSTECNIIHTNSLLRKFWTMCFGKNLLGRERLLTYSGTGLSVRGCVISSGAFLVSIISDRLEEGRCFVGSWLLFSSERLKARRRLTVGCISFSFATTGSLKLNISSYKRG